jgi:hypothetical protein
MLFLVRIPCPALRKKSTIALKVTRQTVAFSKCGDVVNLPVWPTWNPDTHITL